MQQPLGSHMIPFRMNDFRKLVLGRFGFGVRIIHAGTHFTHRVTTCRLIVVDLTVAVAVGARRVEEEQ